MLPYTWRSCPLLFVVSMTGIVATSFRVSNPLESRYGNKPKGASPCMFSVELCSADTGVPMFCWRRAGMVHRGDQLAAMGSHAA
jgi:hypothetical protein